MRCIPLLGLIVALLLPIRTLHAGTPHPWYLALGDSISVGVHVAGNQVYPGDRNCTNAAIDATGRGGWVCLFLTDLQTREPDTHMRNLALNGEDSCSFTTRIVCGSSGRSVGGEGKPIYDPATTSQLNAALRFLRRHPNTRVITFELGGNDLLSLALQNPVNALRNEPAVLRRTEDNEDRILRSLRQAAPQAVIILADLYNPLSGVSSSFAMQSVNLLLDTVTAEYAAFVRAEARKYGAIFVDLRPVFNGKAGTYIGTDHVHPSDTGQQQIAGRMWTTYSAAQGNHG